MLAYLNQPELKTKAVATMRQHRKDERLLQSYGYWINGKGCAVGCLVHKDENAHEAVQKQFGIPLELAFLEDGIFEGLPEADALKWPEQFLSAIHVGADLSRVHYQFCHWLLTDSDLLTITDKNRKAIADVAELHRRAASGEEVLKVEWSAAESAAWSASSAARSAAWSAAWSAACQKMASKLLSLLRKVKA